MAIVMNGKVVKVAQYNMEFGARDRFVNLIGCFKYTPNGNIYVVYSDVDDKHGIVYYGTGHVRGNSALCMQCRTKEEAEIIKEYLFKIVGDEVMSGVQELSLDEVEELELIEASRLDIKIEALKVILDKKLPKKEEIKEEIAVTKDKGKPKKKGKFPKVLILLLLLGLMGGGIYCMFPKPENDAIARSITCRKKYKHNELEAEVEEINKYNFNVNENLEYVDTTKDYQFDKEAYDEFILKGTYYRYMPDDGTLVKIENDNDNYKFAVITKVNVSSTYQAPTKYEEVLSYYENDGYTCNEEIVG